MSTTTALTVLSAFLLLASVPSGRCFMDDLLDAVTKTSSQMRDSAADLGYAGIESVKKGREGIHNMVKFASDTLTDYHTNTLGSLVRGHRKSAELLGDGVEGLADLGRRIGVQVRDTAYTGTREAGRNGVEWAKSSVDVLNKAATGTTNSLRTLLQESAGRVIEAMPKTSIVTPLLELPYNLAHSTLDALTEIADDSAERTKVVLNNLKPDN